VWAHGGSSDAGYKIEGREDAVTALHDIHLAADSEYYPIRRCVCP
jgi:hypothetical protein